MHYFALVQEPLWIELLIPAVLFGCLLCLLSGTLIRRTSLCVILAFLVGMAAAKWETERYATPMLGSSVSTILTARIVSMDQEAETNGKPGRWRIVADVLTTEKPTLRHAPQRLRLSARDLPALAEVGAVLKGAVRLRPHGGPVRSGQYDFAFHGFFRALGGNGFYLGVPKFVPDYQAAKEDNPERLKWFSEKIGQLRALIGGRIMQALPGEPGAIAAALISGQRAGISETTNEALRMAGLAHILSISGLHLALAAGVVLAGIRGLAGCFPSLSLYYPVKKIAACVALLSSGFYLAVSGGEVAAQRSFIMLAVMLCAVMLDRQALTMRNLAIAAIFSILLTPHEILGPSFQMSYSATGALIAAFAWWRLRKRAVEASQIQKRRANTSWTHKIRLALGGVAATSLVAGTASGLYAAFHFNNMAPLGILGNALAMPLISLMVMPFAVIALLLMPLGMEWLPLQVMGAGVKLVQWVAHFVTGLSPDLIPGLLPVPVLLLWTAAMLAAMVLTSSLRWLALLFLSIGGLMILRTDLPDIIISEDARLVAIRENNNLYVNRARPSAFTLENWRKAYSITEVSTPKPYFEDHEQGFSCEDGLCSYQFADGRVLAYADNPEAGQAACLIGDILVLAYADVSPCEQRPDAKPSAAKLPVIISQQQLALKGVAEIYLQPHQELLREENTKIDVGMQAQATIEATLSTEQASAVPPEGALKTEPIVISPKNALANHSAETVSTNKPARVVFALGAPQRPWHLYRLYSRAARNLPDR